MSTNAELSQSLQSLVDAGTISDTQRNAVVEKLSAADIQLGPKSFKSLLSEALVYLGGVVIVGSGALIIEQTWDDLGRWGRPGVLVLAAVILWIAGNIIYDRKHDDEGRRLTSTLLTGSAGLVGVAANNVLRDMWTPVDAQGVTIDWQNIPIWVDSAQVAISMSLVAFIGILAYRRAHSVLALGVIGGTSLGVSMAVGQLINAIIGPDVTRDQYVSPTLPWLAPTLTMLGSLGWIWLWKRGVFEEEIIAHVLGLMGVFIAINSLRENYSEDVVALILVLVGLVGVWLYVKSHAWPYLLFGLGSILTGGIQLLFKYVEGIGGALASMALGAVLVAVGIRLVKEKPNELVH
jgi:hypothetical protein